MSKKRYLCIPALAVLAVWARAAERVYPVYPLRGDIAIDGRIDEAAWGAAPRATDFLPVGTAEPVEQTTFRIVYDDAHLYVGIRAEESRMARIRVKAKDGGPVWTDDSIEVFVARQRARPYCQLCVNAAGSRTAGPGPKPEDWEAFAAPGDGHYVAELKLPFSLVNVDPKTDKTLYINIGRNHTTGGFLRHSTWSPVGLSFHAPELFARLTLRPEDVSTAQVARIEGFVSLVGTSLVQSKIGETAAEYARLIVRADAVASADPGVTALVDKWRLKREETLAYRQYLEYFRPRYGSDALWDAEHAVLSSGPCARLGDFLYGVQSDPADEEAWYRLQLEHVLKGD